MKSVIINNQINTYIGDFGFYLNQDNKNLSYLNKVSIIYISGIEKELKKKGRTQYILGTTSDPYPNIECEYRNTRKVLELIDKYKCGVTIYTKSKNILNDLDILESIALHSRVNVILKISSLSNSDLENIELTKFQDKIDVLEALKDKDINVGLFAFPILPFINDDINTMKDLMDLGLRYNVSYFMYNFSDIIISNKAKDDIYKILDEKYFGLKRKYDAIREEKYKIESPKSKMLKSFMEGTLSKENIIYDYDQVIKEISCYKRKHKQLSMF